MSNVKASRHPRTRGQEASTWALMERWYESAEFDRAARVFDESASGKPPYPAVLLRARIYLKKAPDTALAFLLERTAPPNDRALRAEREMLLAIGYGRVRQHDAAAESFGAALRMAKALPALRDEITYWRARDWLIQGQADEAARTAEDLGSNTAEYARIRSMHLQSAILRSRGRHREEALALIEVLEAIERTPKPDIELRSWATHTLAALTRELHIPQARRIVESNIEKPWPEYFAENHFQSVKAFAWTCALSGDYFNAFRYLKRAAELARGDAWATLALLDRAYLAKCLGEVRWSRQELAEAELRGRDVDWLSVRGEERIAVLLFAELLAPLDAAKAAYYMALYQRMPPLCDPLLGLSYGQRLCAIADYAAGVVHAALGNRKQGVALLRKSLQIFERDHYDWRAARCALALYDLTKDSAMLECARERLREYPGSWLMEELQRKQAVIGDTGLTPMQDAVFRDICAGCSTDEIAQKYQRSKFTIRNHVKSIFRAFGVNTRSALVAEALRRRLL